MDDNKVLKNGNDLISLIRGLLLDEKVVLEDVDYSGLFSLAKFHSLGNILYYAIKKYIDDGNNVSNEKFLTALKTTNRIELAKTATQEAEKELLKETLEKNKIKYMLLKGSVIKYYYPSYDMRSMADIDIYFDNTKHKQVKKMMQSLGYDTESYLKGNHDSFMKKPFMNVEMHRDLMSDCFEMSLYYKNFFNRLIKKSDYEYEFSKEDYYIFMIAHASKHFSKGGTGIRSFVDIYLYLDKNEQLLDFDYIKKELEKLGLTKFEENSRNLAKLWFSNEDISKEKYDLLMKMANFIMTSGTYGTVSHSVLNDLIGEETLKNLESSKAKYLFKRILPPYKTMVKRNPILKKLPILLPWFWFTRLLKGLFSKKDKFKSEIDTVGQADNKLIEENKKIHEDIGA